MNTFDVALHFTPKELVNFAFYVCSLNLQYQQLVCVEGALSLSLLRTICPAEYD